MISVKPFMKDNIIPEEVKYIGIFDKDDNLKGKIRVTNEIKNNDKNPKLTIGLLSDTHYNDTDPNLEGVQGNDKGYQPEEDLDNVLNEFIEKYNVDYICVAGDITTNIDEHAESWYGKISESKLPMFSCRGNHDNAAYPPIYKDISQTIEYKQKKNFIINCPEGIVINYFEKDENDSSSFSYWFEKDNVVFIFLNLNYQNGSAQASNKLTDGSYRYYEPTAIKELQKILDNNRDKMCLVFTHYFFPNKSGNPSNDYTREDNSHPHEYWLTGQQFVLLNELNNHYKNSIWLSGHSHYQWRWQHTNDLNGNFGEYHCDRANVCNWDGLDSGYTYADYNVWARTDTDQYSEEYDESAYNVHIPSLSRPLRLGKFYNSYNICDPGSEFGIMEVYDDFVIIKGVNAADSRNNIITGYKKVIELDELAINPDTGRSNYSTEQKVEIEDGYICLTFTNKNQGFSIPRTYGECIIIDDDYPVKIFSNGVDKTKLFESFSDPKIGFYDSSTAKYTFNSTTLDGSRDKTGLQVSISSTFDKDVDFPITMKIKGGMGYRYDKIDYSNKLVPVAQYKLQIGKNIDSKEFEFFEGKLNDHK